MFYGEPIWEIEGSGEVIRARGNGIAQLSDFLLTLTQDDFAKSIDLLATSTKSRAGPAAPLTMEETKVRQRKLGELRQTGHLCSNPTFVLG